MMKRNMVLLVLLIALIGACSKKEKAHIKATNYFFAPKAGTHFIYKLEPHASHVVTISKIAKGEDGRQIIELHERISNLPSLPGEIEFRTEYIVDIKRDVVYQSRKYLGGSEEVITLQGPVGKGKPWEVHNWMAITEEEDVSDPSKIGIHSCEIAEREELELLGAERDCIRVVCTDEGYGRQARMTFCKGLGYTGMEYMDDDEWEDAETLIQVKELPQGVPM